MPLQDSAGRPADPASGETTYGDDPLQDRLNARVLDRVLSVVRPPRDAHFLDVCCGTGYHTLALAGRGYRCTGVDASPPALKTAEQHLARSGLSGLVTFACQPVESLRFPDASFDVVYCRRALTHVPRWEHSLAHLCRVLRPGGRIVVLESCHTSVGAVLLRLRRYLGGKRPGLKKVPGGLEFWVEVDGRPVLTRVARIPSLMARLRECRVDVVARFATEFWDARRLPRGPLRNAAVRFNRLYFGLRLPAWLSAVNAVVGEKQA